MEYLINTFKITNFTISDKHQVAFLTHSFKIEDYQKYFLNHINEKNYKKINPSFFSVAKHKELEEFVNVILKNKWSTDYRVGEKDWEKGKKHFIYHFVKKVGSFKSEELGSLASKIVPTLDVNKHYNESNPLFFDLILNDIDFDMTKVDVLKLDNEGNQVISYFVADLGGSCLINQDYNHHTQSHFNYLLSLSETDIYHKNKEGESFISSVCKELMNKNSNMLRRTEERQNLKKVLKQVFKNKPYQSNYLIDGQSLEQCLKKIYTAKEITEIEKNNLDNMLINPSKKGNKIKI